VIAFGLGSWKEVSFPLESLDLTLVVIQLGFGRGILFLTLSKLKKTAM
jgi:hypothetical protein